MKTTMVTVLLLSFMVGLSAAQSTCSDQDVTNYISRLPASCGPNLGVVLEFTAAAQSSVLDAALDVVCTESCGGQFANWLLNNCEDTVGSLTLYFSCWRASNTARCRYATEPYTNLTEFFGETALPCYAYPSLPPDMCPPGCSDVLTGIATSIGCCVQGFYNNTDYLQSLVSAGLSTQEDIDGLTQTLRNPRLWAACEVTPPSACTDEGIENPLPTCSDQDVADYVTQKLPPSCGPNLEIALNFTVAAQPSVLDAALDVVCTESCGGQFANWLLNNCKDTVGSRALYFSCLRPGNTAPFSRCRYATEPYSDLTEFFTVTALPCYFYSEVLPDTCPFGCSDVLTGIATSIGCCVQGFYNDTEYLQGLVSTGLITMGEIDGLTQTFRNPRLWAACEVTPPSACTDENPFDSGATLTVTVVKSTLVVFLLIFALFA